MIEFCLGNTVWHALELVGTIVFPFQIWFGSGYISHILYKTLYI